VVAIQLEAVRNTNGFATWTTFLGQLSDIRYREIVYILIGSVYIVKRRTRILLTKAILVI
jgi:hypothetical protein